MTTRTSVILLSCVAIAVALQGCSRPLNDRLTDIVSSYGVPDGPGASVLVADHDSVLFERSIGFADLSEQRPNTPRTAFRLASVTKQFTAMSILILRDQGRLRLDQPITDFFPNFSPVGRAITVENLLTHTSGLVAYEDLMADTTTVPILDAGVLQLVAPIDSTYFPPGIAFRYSNTGYALLALIVQKASGLRFADFLKKNIFDVAGMTRSVAYENGISDVQERAYGYSPNDSASGFHRTDQSTTSSVLGDGGIYSTVEDLFRWNEALLNRTIASASTIDEATSVHAASEDSTSKYGYGWFIEQNRGMKAVYHTGSTIGFRNMIYRIPERRLMVAVLMNRNDGKAEALGRRLVEEVLESER